MDFTRKKGIFTIGKESIASGLMLGIILATLGVFGAFFGQERFQASADFMISSAQEGQDYYTATRSAEYMSRVLGEIVYSESFIASVVNTGRVNANFLPQDKKNRLESWAKMLRVTTNSELGFIHISLVNDSEREVSKIAQAVILVLNEHGSEVFGSYGANVSVRLLSGPIIERNPSPSELIVIVLVGWCVGLCASFAWRLVQEELRLEA